MVLKCKYKEKNQALSKAIMDTKIFITILTFKGT